MSAKQRSGPAPSRSRSGSILILSALMLTVLMGVTALAIDFGNLADYRHRMQSAADAAAVAGAREIKRNSALSLSNLDTLAKHDAALNGFTSGSNGIVIIVNHGPATGPFTGDPKYVEVLISRPVPTFFMGLFGRSTINVGVRAVAGQGPAGSGCIYALGDIDGAMITSGSSDPIEIEPDVWVSGINVPGCDILVNSASSTAFKIGTGWDVTASSISVVGQADLADPSRVHPTPEEGADPVEDPFDGMTGPTPGTPLINDYDKLTGSWEAYPGTYDGGITVRGDANVHFNPGTYIITGSTSLVVKDNATVNGTDVTFWIYPNKPLNFTADAHVHLSAPTTGPYAGILIASTTVGTSTKNIFDTSDMLLNGVIYYPNQRVEWKGIGGASTVLVTYAVKFTGTSAFSSSVGGGGAPSVPGPVSKAE